MNNRKIACLTAAIAMGVSLLGIAGASAAVGPFEDVVVKGDRIDPDLQRRVSYADLNLAFRPGQKILNARIRQTANALCWDLNGPYSVDRCSYDAVRSTDEQVAQAITRAKRQMAGLPVGPAITISMVIGAR
nr:UrcA family protein [uncultured Sphingomonas sp.]